MLHGVRWAADQKKTRTTKSERPVPSCIAHNAGSGGGRPQGLSPKHRGIQRAVKFYEVSHQLVLDIGEAVSPGTSSRALDRVGAILRERGIRVQPNLHDFVLRLNSIFEKDFSSVRLDTDPIPCSNSTEYCELSETASSGSATAPCLYCRHEVVVCNDVKTHLSRWVTAQGRKRRSPLSKLALIVEDDP